MELFSTCTCAHLLLGLGEHAANMAEAEQSQVSLLTTLTEALTSAASALEESEEQFLPPADGISLLDVKNDLLLSYLHNLVFLILLKLRHARSKEEDLENINKELKQKLIELRVYLERGVRPLESRLKYQIDSTLRAAENSKLAADTKKVQKGHKVQPNGATSEGSGSGLDENDSDDADEDKTLASTHQDDAMLYKPNLPAPSKRDQLASLSERDSSQTQGSNGVYKPPRVNPTAMPDPDKRGRGNEPRKRKSQLLNEYIDEEMSSAPRAQPSIGSNNTILDNGRGGHSQRDREKERERTEYEERNFTRLPGETKKEKREARRKGQSNSRDMFGGEDWTGLGGLGDRVSRSVTGGGRDRDGVHKRREKRRATEDTPRSDGMAIGDSFEKRRRVMDGRAAKKAGRKR